MNFRDNIIILVTGTLIEPWDKNWKECEDTWVKVLRKIGYTVMISIGDETIDDYYKIDGNTIYFKTSDTKFGLYDKSLKLPIKWILEKTKYQYYFRIDSDSFVEPYRFDKMLKENLEEFPNLNYMGCCMPYLGWNPFIQNKFWIPRENHKSFASGTAYLISRFAMETASTYMRLEREIERTIDDYVLGRCMRENNIPLLHDSRIFMESKHRRITSDPHNVGVPDISDVESHLAIQHYMNGHMNDCMEKL